MKWVNVTERMPPDPIDILICFEWHADGMKGLQSIYHGRYVSHKSPKAKNYWSANGTIIFREDGKDWMGRVTHWMLVPEPPIKRDVIDVATPGFMDPIPYKFQKEDCRAFSTNAAG